MSRDRRCRSWDRWRSRPTHDRQQTALKPRADSLLAQCPVQQRAGSRDRRTNRWLTAKKSPHVVAETLASAYPEYKPFGSWQNFKPFQEEMIVQRNLSEMALFQFNQRPAILTTILNAAVCRLCDLFEIIPFCTRCLVAFGAIAALQLAAPNSQRAMAAAQSIPLGREQEQILVWTGIFFHGFV
jgi:hypothetical protein